MYARPTESDLGDEAMNTVAWAKAYCASGSPIQSSAWPAATATESPVHVNWKQAIVDAAETDTLFLNERHSPALRALRTTRTTGLQHAEHNVFGDFGDARALYFGGDMEAAIPMSGQVAGRIDGVLPVTEIMAELVDGFAEALGGAADAYLRG